MLWERIEAKYAEKEKIVPAELMRRVERDLMLQIVDAQWKDHLYSLDHLKEGIGLRGYGQRDPLVEYKKESFALFQDMRRRIEEEIVRYLWWLRPVVEGEAGEAAAAPVRAPQPAPRKADAAHLQRSRAPQRAPAFVGAGAAATPAAASPPQPQAAPAPGARRRRRRADQDGAPRRAEDRPQRSVLVRQREEIQEMPRGVSAVSCQLSVASSNGPSVPSSPDPFELATDNWKLDRFSL